MSVLREENTSREDYIQRKDTDSGTEIVTKTSGILSCSNFMIIVQRMSQRTDLHSVQVGAQSLLMSYLMFCHMCNSA